MESTFCASLQTDMSTWPLFTGSIDNPVGRGLPLDGVGDVGQPSVGISICRVAEIRGSPNFESNLSVRDLIWSAKNRISKSS